MIDAGLIVGFAGIFVAALAGVLGVWMEREQERPPWFALFFSALIVFASFIEVGRTVASAYQDSITEDAMARVLEELATLSESGDNPELASFVGAELSRSNPKMLKRVAQRVKDKGGDPDAVRRKAAEGRAGAGGRADGGARPDGAHRPDAGKDAKDAKDGKDGKAREPDAGEGPPPEGAPADGAAPRDGKAPDAPAEGGAKAPAHTEPGKAGKHTPPPTPGLKTKSP